MNVKRPMLVTVIGDLNLIYALFVIASLFSTPKFIEQLGFSFIPVANLLDGTIRILTVIVLLIITYGFLTLKRWGYWTMIGFNLLFLVVSMITLLTHNRGLYIMQGQGFIQSLLGLIITSRSERYFTNGKVAL
jgi:hypothetical protein